MKNFFRIPNQFFHVTRGLCLSTFFASSLLAECVDTPADETFLKYLEQMKSEGWKARHESEQMPNLGCANQTDALHCMSGLKQDGTAQFPLVETNTWSDTWNSQNPEKPMRILDDTNVGSRYWIRASADGRFIARSAAILDLQPAAEGGSVKIISVNAPYDPYFSPDNNAVNYAGGRFCPMSLLLNPSITNLDFTMPGCASFSIGLYQSVGSSLDGTDMLTTAGGYAADYGGSYESTPNWYNNNYINLFTMVFNGETFQQSRTQTLQMPMDGDFQMSPSTRLLVGRVVGLNQQQRIQEGYRVHYLNRDASGTYSTTPAVRFCAPGGKPSVSYDERFITFHHGILPTEFAQYGFESADAPAFQEMLTKKVVNIFLHDLKSGTTTRITNMKPGQFALHPSFRSDGWIYFVVKDPARGRETYVASSAALGL